MSQPETIVGLGTRADLVATVPNFDPSRVALSPEEKTIFQCVGRASTIGEVIARAGMAEPRAIAALLALRAKGVIAPARLSRHDPAVLDAALAEDVELDPERKREILDLERSLDGSNHYDILGLRPGASHDEIRHAYHEASRRYHPDRFFSKNLGSYRGRIERIFRRLSEANAVLSDDGRREAYLKAHPELVNREREPAAETLTAEGEARAAERRARMANHPYMARARHSLSVLARAKEAIETGDLMAAMSHLNSAAQSDPRNPEVQALLRETRKKADSAHFEQEMTKGRGAEKARDFAAASAAYRYAANLDAHHALASAKAAECMVRAQEDTRDSKTFALRAVQLEPQNPDFRVILGKVLLQAGLKRLAKREFKQAVRIKKDHEEAKAQLRKLRWTF